MTKTFRKVIRDIKAGEVWGNGYAIITRNKDNIEFLRESGEKFEDVHGLDFNINEEFELTRIKYTFIEALAEYEKGIIIESVDTKRKFKHDINEEISYYNDGYRWEICSEFKVSEILGKWYINK